MLRSVLYPLLYGNPFKLGYVQAGIGIARRRAAYWAEWNVHIQHTQTAQATWYQSLETHSNSLAVLGAGRLFDFNADLPNKISQLKFFDADPKCKSSWKRFARRHPNIQVSFNFVELSGKIYPWAELVRRVLKERRSKNLEPFWDEVLAFLFEIHSKPLKQSPGTPLFSLSASAVVSLNILSQIPIQWQMWIEQALVRAFGKRFVQERESDWLKALRPSCAQLVREHLMLLTASGAKQSLLITDLEYVEYKLPSQLRANTDSTVLNWIPTPSDKNLSDTNSKRLLGGSWVRDTSLPDNATADVFDSLYGVDIADAATLTKLCAGVRIEPLATWTWHIAPQFREQKTHGYLHRVGALALTHQ